MTTINWMIACSLLGITLIIFSKLGKKTLRESCGVTPELLPAVPVVLFGIYQYYAYYNGGTNAQASQFVLGYYAVPALLIWSAKKTQNKPVLRDALALASIWLPLVLHWWPMRPQQTRYDKPLVLISTTIIGLIFWVGLRGLNGTKARFRVRLRYIAWTLAAFACLAPTLLALAWLTQFASFAKLQANLRHFSAATFLANLALIFIYTAWVEEFFFRGIIQNLLEKRFGKNFLTLVVASAIFAAEHLSQNTKSWNPGNWSWTYAGLAFIAGLAYGKLYRKTPMILYPVLLHALIDASWSLFK
jgi:membrane protease YdiL (CAAX protease family)